jgi:hypothetical protein
MQIPKAYFENIQRSANFILNCFEQISISNKVFSRFYKFRLSHLLDSKKKHNEQDHNELVCLNLEQDSKL